MYVMLLYLLMSAELVSHSYNLHELVNLILLIKIFNNISFNNRENFKVKKQILREQDTSSNIL